MTTKIIINADDLGYSLHRDDAIFKLFRLGKITSASIIINGPTAASASKRAQLVGLFLGLHLNLTEGTPLTECEGIKNKKNELPYKMEFRSLCVDMSNAFRESVDEEVVAQIEKFKELTGYYPTHVDGHQHVHILPNMPSILVPIFLLYNVISIRIPEEDTDDYDWLTPIEKKHHDIRYLDAVTARLEYSKHNFKLNDSFIGLGLSGKKMTKEHVNHCLQNKLGLIELIVHPGLLPAQPRTNTEYTDLFDTDDGRLQEFNCLKELNLNVPLVSWSVF